MTNARGRIGQLLLRVYSEFLDVPTLKLTPANAQDRFGIDEMTSRAVLGALVDAGVLTRTAEGAYVRDSPLKRVEFTPRSTGRDVRPDYKMGSRIGGPTGEAA